MNKEQIHATQDTVNIEGFSKWLSIQSKSGENAIKDKTTQWKTTLSKLKESSWRFACIRESLSDQDFSEDFKYFSDEIESEVSELINNPSLLEKESYDELLFMKDYTSPFNFIPYFLTFWSILRIYILPGISLLLPIMAVIIPYIILRYVFKMPLQVDKYLSMMLSLLQGKTPDFNNIHNSSSPFAGLSPLKIFTQYGTIIATLVQSIIQPYWSYKHLVKVDDIIINRGSKLIELSKFYDKIYERLSSLGITWYINPIPRLSSHREAVAVALKHPSYYKLAIKRIGEIEATICLAKKPELCPVRWSSNTNTFRLTDTFDYTVESSRRKPFSIDLSDKNSHSLLTGPNRGGKSTILRSLVLSSLLAHTYGCSIGTDAELSPRDGIFVCLKPDDLPGSKSRFEREVEFTATTLRASSALVFIDELYHSTNPPDAFESSKIYCNQLWKKDGIVSVISTHMFNLVEQAPSDIKRICCSASIEEGTNRVLFSYTLMPGMCTVSSVNELLIENGMLMR
jgi:energy-coupling factor transporter ATP-binding protein EcfA2